MDFQVSLCIPPSICSTSFSIIIRAEALKSFQSNPFFATWDPPTLALYVHHGTYSTTDARTAQPVVRLKMSALQESIMFRCDGVTQRETFERLQTLDERVRLRWVVPGREGEGIGGAGNAERRVWVRKGNASNIRIGGVGHLVWGLSFFFG